METVTDRKPAGFGRTALDPEFTTGKPLIWKREDGERKTNVRWKVRHPSPTGFEIGYSGSGPADPALNAMATLFPISREDNDPVKCFDGKVSATAWYLHQRFKERFLSGAVRGKAGSSGKTLPSGWQGRESA